MVCKKIELYKAYHKLLQIEADLLKNEDCECQAQDMTLKQVYYLRIIDQKDKVTFSQLAQETCNSKPTITELISKFISMDCVYRERSAEDRRVYYIYLTPKGKLIARAQERMQIRFIDHIRNSLTDAELNQLITLLNKIL
ncbi:MAG: MarR family transcriptional regulator [Eubacteriaceae bacterium]|nr:MarR family transcriptional regulator [Eubacteriaceae bacterium]